MNSIQTRTIFIFAALAALMAATRFNHFGTAVSMPDASYAVFFLGGLYLARSVRVSAAAFIVLILEAGLIDVYATSVQGISEWCMTTAYWFLIPTYGGLWLVGHWSVTRHTRNGQAMGGSGLFVLALAAWAACSFAFMFSNAAFYLFSERFAEMSMVEYASRVFQYYGSYTSVALLYIACAVALHIAIEMITRQRVHSRSDMV
jgi:hypothetical protein